MPALLLDTHVLIWLAEDDHRLGKKARLAIGDAYAKDALFVSAMSFWEIGMLISKGRITLPRSLDHWRAEFLSTGITEIAMSGDAAILSTELDWSHQDPADRIIVAAAMVRGLQLLTADKVILDWKNPLKRLDASA